MRIIRKWFSSDSSKPLSTAKHPIYYLPAPLADFVTRGIRILLPLVAFFLVFGVFSFNLFFYLPFYGGQEEIAKGKINMKDVYAQVDFSYVDDQETAIQRQREAGKGLNIYTLQQENREKTIDNFKCLLQQLHDKKKTVKEKNCDSFLELDYYQNNILLILFNNNKDKENFFILQLQSILSQGVISSKRIHKEILNSDILIVENLKKRRRTKISRLYTPQTAASELLKRFISQFGGYHNTAVLDDLSRNVFANLIQHTLQFDQQETLEMRNKLKENFPPVKKKIQKGTIFLARGKPIDKEDLRKLFAHLKTLNTNTANFYVQSTHRLALGFIMLVMGALCLMHQRIGVCKEMRFILLIALTLSCNLLLIKGTKEFLPYLPQIKDHWNFLYPSLPLAFTAVFLTILHSKDLGFFAGWLIALLAALPEENPIHVFSLGFACSTVGVLSVYGARTRTKTFRSAIFIALMILIIESTYLLKAPDPVSRIYDIPLIATIAIINGFLVLLFINLLLPLAEYCFRVTTNITLLELSDLNHPLLKQLQLEAPGTYHHSLMVANLAEQAAGIVGANPLLTRVCAYFHDIGKLANPIYFTENCFGADHHKTLTPRISSLIILNHVTEGLKLAKKYKLKRPLRNVIMSHHGTSLVYYFYHRAMNEKRHGEKPNHDHVDKDDFRYPGPLPVTKEESIISLADSCEAASRSLPAPTRENITTLVSQIIHNKITDGQLDNSQLTMSQVKEIQQAIIENLITMLHRRISYPKDNTAEKNNEDQHDKSSTTSSNHQQQTSPSDDSRDTNATQFQEKKDT